MRLLRFVAVACMVTVGVVSLGCGEPVAEKTVPAEKPAATTPDTDSSAMAEKATTGTTPVSLTITGMA